MAKSILIALLVAPALSLVAPRPLTRRSALHAEVAEVDEAAPPPLTDAQFKALETPLTTEQRESIVPEDNVNLMVEDALRFLRCYGGQLPQPYCVPSRPNFKKVLGFAVRLRVSG